MKYYHASPHHHTPGDVLAGKSRCADHRGLWVFMTTSQVPHYTVIERALDGDWFVYEVKPIGKVKFGGMWDEAVAKSVEVIRRVGKARGIHRNRNKHFKRKRSGISPGSHVFNKKDTVWRSVRWQIELNDERWKS